ncbi:MAG TPA: alkaline phosphatase family protein [Candidatus Cybelea sp.]|jgi:phospholipase C|nr:alkaline phosphatase family protein [Candidatus Cybelea sp.]
MSRRYAFVALVAAAILGACSTSGSNSAISSGVPLRRAARSSGVPLRQASRTTGSPIQHVVIIIQENRSFNDFFATYPGADGTTTGQAIAESNCSPPIKPGPITLAKANLVVPMILNHSYQGFDTAWDGGKLDAFDAIPAGKGGPPECTEPYQYTDPAQIQPYWSMAQQYVLAEHMFTTQGSDSFTAHQDLIRGGTIVAPGKAMVDFPTCSGSKCIWGCDAPAGTHTNLITQSGTYKGLQGKGPFPCSKNFRSRYLTLRDLLDSRSISWKYYVPPMNTTNGRLFSAFDVIYPVRYGPEWTNNVITPQTQIFNDITNGKFPAISWVIPDALSSDHPGEGKDYGPSWVASIVNAIGQSAYWNSTAIIIVWDDWGGLYDNLGMLDQTKYGYGGLGLRVPAIIISPYARAGLISQTNYEFGSILQYIEQNWGLGSLGTSDARAASLSDCFNYLQTPIPFKPIASQHSKQFFLHQKPSYLPVDTDM